MAVNIFQMQDYRSFLRESLHSRCLRNSRYSLRAFARDLTMAPSLLSLLINGKSTLSLEKARVISLRLNLEDHERDYFVALVDKERSGRDATVFELRKKYAFKRLKAEDSLPQELDLDDFALMLKISLLGGIKADSESSLMLATDIESLAAACERLAGLGWLEGSRPEGWFTQRPFLRADGYDRSESRRIFHQKVLEMGLNQLHQREIHERFFNSWVFSFKEDGYEDFCRELSAFCDAKCDAYGTRNSHNRIYALGFQLLPVADLIRPATHGL